MLNLTQDRTPRGIRIDELCKHLFICGMPGSGKTTGTFPILLQLFERHIPFVVLETAKKEYRALKGTQTHHEPAVRGLAEKLEVYTADNELLSPLRFNPLWRPPGVAQDLHIDMVLRCFKASLPMYEPLPALLGEALEVVYRDSPEKRLTPTLDDLYMATQQVLNNKRYAAEIKGNLLASMEVRLGTLTRGALGAMLRTFTCIPDIAHLARSYSVIEMDELEVEIKCLLTLFVLTAIQQYVRMQAGQEAATQSCPRLVIVIEEAHNIVGRYTDVPSGENQVNPKANATELICRMLAEFRALGVGIILIDQHPSQVAPQVIKNTGTKLTFHEVDREERQILADAMLFSDLEYEEIARLLPGEAYLFGEGYHRSHRLRTPHVAQLLHLPRSLTDQHMASRVGNDTWYHEAQVRRTSDNVLRFRVAMNHCRKRMSEARRELNELLDQRSLLARMPNTAERRGAARRLAAAVERVGRQVEADFAALEGGLYQEVCRIDVPKGPRHAQLDALQHALIQDFESGIRSETNRLREFTKGKVAQLNSDVSL